MSELKISNSDNQECRLSIEDCDSEIARYHKAILDGSGDISVCKDKINEWLECRLILQRESLNGSL